MKKVALVTGGSKGIGRAIAKSMASDRIHVALTYNSNKDLAISAINDIVDNGFEAISVKLDQRNQDHVKNAVSEVKDHFGPINIVVNNAGIAQEKPFETITVEDFDNMIMTNLRGPFLIVQEVIKGMKQENWGRIINISSIGGQWGGVNQVHYALAKAGLINFSKSLARMYGKYNITANTVAPGLVSTEMVQNELSTPEGMKKLESIPLGRIATTEEVSNVVNFLSSEKSSYITGQTINVNGGMYFG